MPTFWKPEKRSKAKRRTTRKKQVARAICRALVLQRDDQRCRACQSLGDGYMLEVHEEPPRSQGGDPTDPKDCVTLCRKCHHTRHRGVRDRLLIEKLDLTLGANGLLRFTLTTSGQVIRVWER